MNIPKHKVFISYHHANDQFYKEKLLQLNQIHELFIDGSVDTGDIDERLPDERIREIIRDDYLGNTTVTILLNGTDSKKRKHIDWELYSSMYDGSVNKKSGILIINLPSISNQYFTASHSGEKEEIYSERPSDSWTSINERSEYERRYPYMPERIIDNLLNPSANTSVVNWNKIESNPRILKYLIDLTFKDKLNCKYDLSRNMRRNNS